MVKSLSKKPHPLPQAGCFTPLWGLCFQDTLRALVHHTLSFFTQATMRLVVLLALCCLASSTHGIHFTDLCSPVLKSGVKPGFPKIINTDNPGVLKAARHSVEKFNNCTNDIFLFKESGVSRALVQVVKGLKYMLEVEIGRTTCRKTAHPHLDNCDFQTNPALKQILHCYSEVWVMPWLHSFQVPVLRCQMSVSSAGPWL